MKKEMLYCWPRQVAGHLEKKSQVVSEVLQTHNWLPVVELVFFSCSAELQPTPVGIKLSGSSWICSIHSHK